VVDHRYAEPGRYDVSLVVANTAGTSTEKVSTGSGLLRNGGTSAVAESTVSVGPAIAPPASAATRRVTPAFAG